jgi:hypothetical protein
MMKISDLSPRALEKIKTLSYDKFIEKHELYGYEYLINHLPNDLVFIKVDGHNVLTPHRRTDYDRITFHRCNVSKNEQTLILFYTIDYNESSSDLFAICERVPNENFFIALIVHEVYDFKHVLLYQEEINVKIP